MYRWRTRTHRVMKIALKLDWVIISRQGRYLGTYEYIFYSFQTENNRFSHIQIETKQETRISINMRKIQLHFTIHQISLKLNSRISIYVNNLCLINSHFSCEKVKKSIHESIFFHDNSKFNFNINKYLLVVCYLTIH